MNVITIALSCIGLFVAVGVFSGSDSAPMGEMEPGSFSTSVPQDPSKRKSSTNFRTKSKLAELEPFRGVQPSSIFYYLVVVDGDEDEDSELRRKIEKAFKATALDLDWEETPMVGIQRFTVFVYISRIDLENRSGLSSGVSAAHIILSIDETGNFQRKHVGEFEMSYAPHFEWNHRISASIYLDGALMTASLETLDLKIVESLREMLDRMKIDVREQWDRPIGGAILVEGLRKTKEAGSNRKE